MYQQMRAPSISTAATAAEKEQDEEDEISLNSPVDSNDTFVLDLHGSKCTEWLKMIPCPLTCSSRTHRIKEMTTWIVETLRASTATDNKALPLNFSSDRASSCTVLLRNKTVFVAITCADAVNNYTQNYQHQLTLGPQNDIHLIYWWHSLWRTPFIQQYMVFNTLYNELLVQHT